MGNFVFICLLVVGVIELICFCCIFYFSRKTTHWSMVKGRVMSSEVCAMDVNNCFRKNTYKSEVSYRYSVQDNIFISKRIYYGDWIAIISPYYAKKIVNRYKVGEECIVYYNPQQPKNAVLEIKLKLPAYLTLISAILFLAMASILLINREAFVFWMEKHQKKVAKNEINSITNSLCAYDIANTCRFEMYRELLFK